MAKPDHATVFIVDDDQDIRDSLHRLFQMAGLRTRRFDSGRAFLAGLDATVPGCLVLDMALPDMTGLDILKTLADRRMALPAVVLTGQPEVAGAVEAMKAGAFDYMEKPASAEVLLRKVSAAIEASTDAHRRRGPAVEIAARYAELSDREREVMRLVAAGRSGKEIAGQLGLSARTVEVHRSHVLEKMGADSTAALVRMALLLEQLPPASGPQS